MRKVLWICAIVAGLLVSGTLQAEKYSSKSSTVTVAGTSTLHDWSCPAHTVNAVSDLTLNGADLATVNSMWVEVMVKSIKSEKEAMDDKIYEALKADNNPKITFQMLKMKSIEKKNGEYAIVANGTMTIAGSAQNVDLNVTAKILPNGDIEFKGSKKMKMTSFKVDPPTAMWGVIKSGDDITVSFSLTVKKG